MNGTLALLYFGIVHGMAGELSVLRVKHKRRACVEVSGKNLLRDESFGCTLEVSLERTCAVNRVISLVDDKLLRRVCYFKLESARLRFFQPDVF